MTRDPVKLDVVLIPGLLNDGDLWRDQISGLSDIARCWVGDMTQAATLRACAESILAKAPDRFALVGFSLGGFVAQDIMRIACHRVSHLALLDTSIKPDTPERAAQRRALVRAARMPGKFHGFGDRLLSSYLHPDHLTDDLLASRVRAMTERLGPEVFARQSEFERLDGADVLRHAHCPVLILCGENDLITPLQDHKEMARLPESATLVVVPRSGHLTPLENPAFVTHALRQFLLG